MERGELVRQTDTRKRREDMKPLGPSSLQSMSTNSDKSGDNPRRASFLARMGNMPGPEYKDGEPTRLLLSLRAWGASSKADARAKSKAISARNKK